MNKILIKLSYLPINAFFIVFTRIMLKLMIYSRVNSVTQILSSFVLAS